jgi:hypothetical protein
MVVMVLMMVVLIVVMVCGYGGDSNDGDQNYLFR